MEPFYFHTKLDQTVLLGIKAKNVQGLLEGIRQVPSASIYHHTHRFLQQHHYLSPEPPNDFSYWVSEVLGDDALGEQVSSIDIIQFADIVFVHDPQPVVLVEKRKDLGRRWIWRCHIDFSRPDAKVWKFLERYIGMYDAAVFLV